MPEKKTRLEWLGEFEKDRVEKNVESLGAVYGISRKDILAFLDEKRTKGPSDKEHRFFAAFQTIDEVFDEMIARILTTLESWGVITERFPKSIYDEAHALKVQDEARKKLIKTIVRETQDRIKDELPLPKGS